jgi:hypothetical protein
MVQHDITHGIHDSQHSDADGSVSLAERENQQRFDYIENLMNQARKGRVIERTERVEIKRPEAPDQAAWREQAFEALETWRNKRSWAAVYIRCGSCFRDFSSWMESNEIDQDSPEWVEAAKKIILEKNWI